MKIDTISLRIDFPRRSTEIRKDEKKERTWKDFKVTGFLEREVGHIKVSYTTKYPLEEINDFWHNIDYNPPRIRPVVVWQETLPEFYGNGICGRIIIKANEIAKVRFGEPLSSDTLFVQNPSGDWQEKNYDEHPARKVWEKLEREGLAYNRPYEGHSRWVMI